MNIIFISTIIVLNPCQEIKLQLEFEQAVAEWLVKVMDLGF